jgi:hypothetical protein
MAPDHAENLPDQTFYLHSDIVGKIDDYRRSRPSKRRNWIQRLLFLEGKVK